MRDLDNHWLKTDEEDQEEGEKKKEMSLLNNKHDFFKQSDHSFPTFPPLDSSLFSNVFESEDQSLGGLESPESLEDSFETDRPEGNGDGQPQLNTFSVKVSRHRIR